jgi:elongation factor P--(R)-beta-lysine ligase
MTSDRPWWTRDAHTDRRPLLAARGHIKSAIREWFEDQDFVEVEPGCLQVSPGNEMHLRAFEAQLVAPDQSRRTLYLHTSPEFACKKLLAAGERQIFTFAPVFRNGERGALHAPEFTMLEWYRAEAPYERAMDDCAALLALAMDAAGARVLTWRGVTCDPHAAPERLTVAEAFERYAGIELLTTIDDREALARGAEAAGVPARADDTWADIFAKVLTALIEPKLGIGQPTLLVEYPASEAALARAKLGDTRVAERFELYCCGVELANGFGELTDPELQRQRLECEMDRKQARYGERYPIDEDFIRALAHMPAASGCALGFDRLVMLAAGATHIDQVLWTPLR